MSRFDSKSNRPRSTEFYDDLAIFFLSDTHRLNENYEFFKSELIPTIIVDLRKEGSNFEDFDILSFKINDSTTNTVVLRNFQTLMLSVLGIKNEYYNFKPFDYSNLTFDGNIEEINNLNKSDGIEKIFMLNGYPIRIIEGNKCIGKIEVNLNDIDHRFSLVCWIEHLNQVLFIHRNESGSIYDKHGNLIKQIPQFSYTGLADRYSSIDYSRKNRFTYFCQPIYYDHNHSYTWDSRIILFNEYLDPVDKQELDWWDNDRGNIDRWEHNRLEYRRRYNRRNDMMRHFDEIRIRGRQIKIFDDFIYTLHCDWEDMYIYDLKLNLIAVIKHNYGFKWLKDICESTQANYLFQNDCILNTKTFSIISKNLKSNWHNGGELEAIHNDKFIFSRDKVYKMNMNTLKCKNFIDDKYLCKINPLKYHLLKNPIILPCGNMICNDCFYENYNIYLNRFICNFVSCQIKHMSYEINFLLDSNNRLVENSAAEILKEMIDNCNKTFINKKSKFKTKMIINQLN